MYRLGIAWNNKEFTEARDEIEEFVHLDETEVGRGRPGPLEKLHEEAYKTILINTTNPFLNTFGEPVEELCMKAFLVEIAKGEKTMIAGGKYIGSVREIASWYNTLRSKDVEELFHRLCQFQSFGEKLAQKTREYPIRTGILLGIETIDSTHVIDTDGVRGGHYCEHRNGQVTVYPPQTF